MYKLILTQDRHLYTTFIIWFSFLFNYFNWFWLINWIKLTFWFHQLLKCCKFWLFVLFKFFKYFFNRSILFIFICNLYWHFFWFIICFILFILINNFFESLTLFRFCLMNFFFNNLTWKFNLLLCFLELLWMLNLFF